MCGQGEFQGQSWVASELAWVGGSEDDTGDCGFYRKMSNNTTKSLVLMFESERTEWRSPYGFNPMSYCRDNHLLACVPVLKRCMNQMCPKLGWGICPFLYGRMQEFSGTVVQQVFCVHALTFLLLHFNICAWAGNSIQRANWAQALWSGLTGWYPASHNLLSTGPGALSPSMCIF